MPWNSLLTTRRQLLAASAATGAVSLLLGQFAAATETATIRPFHVSFPEQALVDLRQRIEATRWPARETVPDATQGVQLATIQKLVRHWGTNYDWRKCEAKLKALAVTSEARWPELPAVPTMKEVGIEGIPTEVVFGLLAPRDAPPAIVDVLNRAVNEGRPAPLSNDKPCRHVALPSTDDWTAAAKLMRPYPTICGLAGSSSAEGDRWSRP